jgi:GDP-L-fucose synthase
MQYGYQWNCFVPSTLYGIGYHTDGRQMHFIFDLIKKIIRAKEFNETVTLWGSGYQKREIVFIDDFIKNLIIINDKESNQVFNLGAGVENSIREYAVIISNIIDYDSTLISYDESRYVGAQSKCLSIEKVTKLIPDYSTNLTRLEKGLRRTIEWFYQANAY